MVRADAGMQIYKTFRSGTFCKVAPVATNFSVSSQFGA